MKFPIYFLIFFLFFVSPHAGFAQNANGIHKEEKALQGLASAGDKPFNLRELEYRSDEGTLGGERNSAWFKLSTEYDTTYTFDIVPFDSLDDYDFVLFKCEDVNCIGNKEKFKKIRACWSHSSSKSGMTGLSQYSTKTEIGGGGLAYTSAVKVKAGEIYYLMIDYDEAYLNQGRRPAGFMIYFYNYCPRKKPVILNNIFFESGKAVLKTESFPELDKLALLLKKSQMVIEIRGHTDNEGDEKKNQLLSEERAKAVVDYLASKKIYRNRLFYKGFGSSRPLANNATKEARQKNRRVEFAKVMY